MGNNGKMKKVVVTGSNGQLVSSFQISYTDIIGGPRAHNYELSKKDEGRMLFFPSQLNHAVYPFFNCDEERISVSGNVYDITATKGLVKSERVAVKS